MPQFHIHVTSSDGSIESPDPEGIALGDIGAARALAVQTLMTVARDVSPARKSHSIIVTLENDRGQIVYRDFVVLDGPQPNPDDAAVGRAIGVMCRS